MRIVSLESRREQELASLVRRHGGQVIQAPSMAERPLTDQSEALRFGEQLMGGACDGLVLLTGVGLSALLDALGTRWPRADVVAALRACALLSRGPKPVAVLKAEGLSATLVAAEPNTWRELLAAIDASFPVAGKRLWVQEYGERNDALLDALRQRGAEVCAVPIYAWTLPDDTGPLCAAVQALCDGGADVLMFTSGQQARHLLTIARQAGCEAALLDALATRVLVASIGPVTGDALLACGIHADFTPGRPKMGPFVKELLERGPELLSNKRAQHA